MVNSFFRLCFRSLHKVALTHHAARLDVALTHQSELHLLTTKTIKMNHEIRHLFEFLNIFFVPHFHSPYFYNSSHFSLVMACIIGV